MLDYMHMHALTLVCAFQPVSRQRFFRHYAYAAWLDSHTQPCIIDEPPGDKGDEGKEREARECEAKGKDNK